MRRLNNRAPRIAGLLALALGAVALLALSGGAAAKDRRGDDHGHHHGHHHHHFHEMREAGTISSFDAATGKLTIALTGGESTTGLVTAETRIKCEGVDDRLHRRDHGGDDHGGHFEPGDDHGGDNSGPGSGDSSGSGPGPSGESGPTTTTEGAEESEGSTCGVAALVPGAFVGEAELRLGTGMAVFEEIELGHDS
jgi:hypothetical protein